MSRIVIQNHQEPEVEEASSSSNGFVQFNRDRAKAWVDARKRSGLKVMSPEGLAFTKERDAGFLAESKRIWAHRDCQACRGEGFTEAYAPGAGQRQIECAEGVGGVV